MAPLPNTLEIADTSHSSLELESRPSSISPAELSSYLSSLSLADREALTNPPITSSSLSQRDADLSPLHARSLLLPRASIDPASGTMPPEAFNNKGIQVLFALIGASFVLGAIWFFFWAKNGGFKWQKGDWDDYKSTVLRRKGPNGTTLSNATKSTRLGGGSVVGEGYSDGTMTELSSEAPILSEKRQSRNSKGQKKESSKDRKLREQKEAEWEGGADNDVRAYRHERVAKVGGLNRDSDAQFYGTDYSETEPSVTQAHRSREERRASRQASPEKRTRDRHQEASRQHTPQAGGRPTRYHSPSKNQSSRASIPESFAEPSEFDTQSQNTKSYHHPLPGLSGGAGKASGGFRRGMSDGLDD